MEEKNNPNWQEDSEHDEIVKCNKRLMRDSCLLIKGASYGALVAAI